MQILFRYPLLIVCSVLLAIVACSDDDVLNGGIDEGKTPIELAAGVAEGSFAAPAMRAVVTDGQGKTLRAFNKDTHLFFVVKAEDVRHTEGSAKWGLNYATAAGLENPADNSSICFPDNNYLYWDDAYARDSKVSVYSMAAANSQSKESANIGGKDISTTNKKIDFSTDINSLDIKWTIGDCGDGAEVAENEKRNYQNATTVGSQDLVFSNNIQGDNTLCFNNTETGKFDKGHLIYYHALSKLTVKIICDEGFKGDGTDFQFTNKEYEQDNSFSIKGFYHRGTLNIGTGEYTNLNTRTFSSIYLSHTNPNQEANPYYTLEALVFPGTDMSASGGELKDMFSFVIDDNRYDISRAKLYEALQNGGTNDVNTILDGGKRLKAGYNYEFTFTVGKTKIRNVTAKVADWETVEAANQYPSNAHVVLSLEDRGEDITENANIYRAAEVTDALLPDHDITQVSGMGYNWAKKYEQPNVFKHVTKKLDTTWYWPDNKTFYHFRAIAPTTVTVVPTPATPQTSDADCYVQLTAKENYTDAEGTPHSYTDVRWGAPFFEKEPSDPTSNTEKFDYGPETNGFDGLDPGAAGYEADQHQIYHAIGATDYGINLILFHAMSKVTIKVVSQEGDAHVAVAGAKIQLQNIYTQGQLMMGNGLVTGTGDKTNYDFQGSAPTWKYGAIPQDLSGVTLDITTTDNNHYKVNLGAVYASSVTNNNLKNPYTKDEQGRYNINRWYPGFKYEYTFELSKAEVHLLKCTILDWEEVVAGDDNVQIQ